MRADRCSLDLVSPELIVVFCLISWFLCELSNDLWFMSSAEIRPLDSGAVF